MHKRRQISCYNRTTGETGKTAKEDYDNYRSTEVRKKIVVCSEIRQPTSTARTEGKHKPSNINTKNTKTEGRSRQSSTDTKHKERTIRPRSRSPIRPFKF